MSTEKISDRQWFIDGVRVVLSSADEDTEARARELIAESQVVTPEDQSLLREQQVKSVCGRRIYAVAAQHTQMNLVGVAAVGGFTAEQADAYAQAVQWIGDMRVACAAIIGDDALDPSDDANWPECPAAVRALAEAF